MDAEKQMDLLTMAEEAERLAHVLGESTPGGYSLAMLFARYLRMEGLHEHHHRIA